MIRPLQGNGMAAISKIKPQKEQTIGNWHELFCSNIRVDFQKANKPRKLTIFPSTEPPE